MKTLKDIHRHYHVLEFQDDKYKFQQFMKCKGGSNTHFTAYAKIAHSFAAMCKKASKNLMTKQNSHAYQIQDINIAIMHLI